MNKTLTEKKIDEISNFLAKNVDKKAAKGFNEADDKVEWIKRRWPKLETYETWVNKYPTLDDLTLLPEQQMEKVYKQFPNFDDISEQRMKYLISNNDFSKEQLKDYYDFMEAKQAEETVSKEENLKELNKQYREAYRSKNGGYMTSPLANEYAREAYIKGNEKAALAHEIAGKAAAAADFAPIPFAMAGPIIRETQAFVSGRNPSIKETAVDYGMALIPDLLEKPARYGYNMLKSALNRVFPGIGRESKTLKNIGKELNTPTMKEIKAAGNNDIDIIKDIVKRQDGLEHYTDKELYGMADKINDPVLKNKIYNHINARKQYQKSTYEFENAANLIDNGVDNPTTRAVADNAMANKETALKQIESTNTDMSASMVNHVKAESVKRGKGEVFNKAGDLNPEYFDVPNEVISETVGNAVTLSPKEKLVKTALTAAGYKAARSMPRGTLFKLDTFDPSVDDISDKQLDQVIKDYSDDWNYNKVPANYDNPIIRAAYDRWKSKPLTNYRVDWREK